MSKEAQPKQEQGEPVAQTLRDAVFTVLEGFTLDSDVRKILESAYYTTPQQRTWVGLTDKRRVELAVFNGWGQAAVSATLDLAKAIEAELREKNT